MLILNSIKNLFLFLTYDKLQENYLLHLLQRVLLMPHFPCFMNPLYTFLKALSIFVVR